MSTTPPQPKTGEKIFITPDRLTIFQWNIASVRRIYPDNFYETIGHSLEAASLMSALFWEEGQPDNSQFSDLDSNLIFQVQISNRMELKLSPVVHLDKR